MPQASLDGVVYLKAGSYDVWCSLPEHAMLGCVPAQSSVEARQTLTAAYEALGSVVPSAPSDGLRGLKSAGRNVFGNREAGGCVHS